jgi:hypothetical protein
MGLKNSNAADNSHDYYRRTQSALLSPLSNTFEIQVFLASTDVSVNRFRWLQPSCQRECVCDASQEFAFIRPKKSPVCITLKLR